MGNEIIRCEKDLKRWFLKNYRSLGYSKILRKDIGEFPDFIMIKKGKKVNVELETISSNFIMHNHDINNADEIVCVKKDVEIGSLPIIELKQFTYSPRMFRISATVLDNTKEIIDMLLKDREYRNKSHMIEKAIKFLWESKNAKKK